jgi:hypothetical protein
MLAEGRNAIFNSHVPLCGVKYTDRNVHVVDEELNVPLNPTIDAGILDGMPVSYG